MGMGRPWGGHGERDRKGPPQAMVVGDVGGCPGRGDDVLRLLVLQECDNALPKPCRLSIELGLAALPF